jgi:hypothetical protein
VPPSANGFEPGLVPTAPAPASGGAAAPSYRAFDSPSFPYRFARLPTDWTYVPGGAYGKPVDLFLGQERGGVRTTVWGLGTSFLAEAERRDPDDLLDQFVQGMTHEYDEQRRANPHATTDVPPTLTPEPFTVAGTAWDGWTLATGMPGAPNPSFRVTVGILAMGVYLCQFHLMTSLEADTRAREDLDKFNTTIASFDFVMGAPDMGGPSS